MKNTKNMNRFIHILISALYLLLGIRFMLPHSATAQLSHNYYSKTCPNVENIVRQAVEKKIQQSSITVAATLRLFFHDCFVNGCDASIMIQSTANNKAEKDNPDNLSLAGDGFDTVIKAKEALDAVPGCRSKVSCADILAIAARDVVNLAGGMNWQVELGRLDGLVSTASSVNGRLPHPTDNLDQLNKLFAANGLSQTDMVALSGAHTVGFAHCKKFSNRIYGFKSNSSVDPSLNPQYATQLQQECPKNVDPGVVVSLDAVTPMKFDNWYYKNLIQGKGLLTSDQVLYTDPRTKSAVINLAQKSISFNKAFAQSMINLGRVGVKTRTNGNVRLRCDAFN